MKRLISAVMLSALPILNAPVLAETAKKSDTFLGAEQFARAWQYDQGLGVPIDIPEAVRWYRKAAAAGHPLAKARLARIYFSGSGVVEDKMEAERLSKGIFPDVLKAAENNDAMAQMIVGTMYADGLGVARDSEEAEKWLYKAADQKLPLAQANLGVMYEHGIGVPRDSAEAARWVRQAADQNNAMVH